MRRTLLTFAVIFSFLAPVGAFATGAAKPPAAIPKFSARAQMPESSVKAKKTVKKKRYKRKLKYVAPPVDELNTEALPVELPIPIEAVEALAKGNVDEATRMLRTESPSSRSLYLLAEMKRILDYEKDKKPPKFERHEFYQNLGIAYHNLFLFLKRNGMTNKEFYKEALKFYKKAGKSRAYSEKYEAQLLTAALKAARDQGAEVALIKLSDLNVQPCNGCMACMTKGEHCRLKDDMDLTPLSLLLPGATARGNFLHPYQ